MKGGVSSLPVERGWAGWGCRTGSSEPHLKGGLRQERAGEISVTPAARSPGVRRGGDQVTCGQHVLGLVDDEFVRSDAEVAGGLREKQTTL